MQLIISVHGIRTYGAWQTRLADLLSKHADTTVLSYKYGYFSVLAFIFPITRWIVTRRFRRRLLDATSSQKWDRIDLVGHSFGTHLIAWGLAGIPPDRRPQIHTIILAGSVLKSTFRWEEFLGKSVQRVVNECGTRDAILLVNQLFVLFTGMAGRIGFNGLMGGQFQNRFYPFGHSDYFLKDGSPADVFMMEKWLPLLTSDGPIPPIDLRPIPTGFSGALTGVQLWALNNAEPVKLILYVAPLIATLTWVYGQWQTAKEQTRLAQKRQDQFIAVSAKEALDHDPTMTIAMLKQHFLSGSIYAVRNIAADAWSRGVAEHVLVGNSGDVLQLVFSEDGRYLITGAMTGELRIWDLVNRTLTGTHIHQESIAKVTINICFCLHWISPPSMSLIIESV